jgi:hypothetical protein
MGPAEGIERHICQLRFGRSTIELHRPKVSYAMRWPCELQPKSLTRLGISRAPAVPARCPACADLLPSRGSTKLSKVGEDVTKSIQGHHLLAASEELGIFHGRLDQLAGLPICR